MSKSTHLMLAALGGTGHSSSTEATRPHAVEERDDTPNLQPDMQALLQNCLTPEELLANTPME